MGEDQGVRLNPKGVMNVAPTIDLRRGDIHDAQLLVHRAILLQAA